MDKRARRCWIALLAVLFFFSFFTNELQAAPRIPYTDIVIDVGHGGIDGGTSYEGLLEKEINLAVAKKLRQHLMKKGLRVSLTRTKDYALSEDNHWLSIRSRHKRDLAQRVFIVNHLKPKLLVSLHVNWSSKSSKTGAVVIYRPNHQPSYFLANVIQDALNHVYRTHVPPSKSDKFYLLNRVSCPSVIIEMGFISNPSDRKMMTTSENQEKLAEAISSALWEYLLLFETNKNQ